MNRPALLVLVRHGQSERNLVKKRNSFYLDDESRKAVKGIPDHLIALTEEGHRQAIATGRALREQLGSFDYVFHSGYWRTIETAAGLLSAYTDEERARMVVRHHLFIRERTIDQSRSRGLRLTPPEQQTSRSAPLAQRSCSVCKLATSASKRGCP